MSLIYNSLKQHEKTADASLKMNPISQRMQTAESQALSKRARGLLYLGAASFAIFGLFVLQVYWNESTHQSPQSSVNQLLLASATQASEQQKTQVVEASSKQNRSTQQSQELALAETEEAEVKQSVDKTSVASNEHLTAVMTVQEKDSTRPGNTLSETELTKVATTKARVEAESQVVRAQEDVAIVRVTGNKDITGDSVVEKPHSPKKTVESATQRQASNKASTATKEIKTHQNETQVVTHKPEMAQPQVLQTKAQKVVVAKADETPEKRADKADIQAEQPQEMVLRKAIMPKKVEDKAVNTGVSAPTIHKNSAEYFIAVKNKVADIKQSIRLNSETELQTQLAELGQLSGKESVIYQRMEAYAALKKQRYRQAANSYRKLLNQKPEDMEANMNLVIALAELGDQQVAKQQLNRLDSLYPESSQLKQYKKMIHAKYGY